MDVCLIHTDPTFVLLVLVEDRILIDRADAKVQVVAGAIVAFQSNNQKREEYGLELDPLDAVTLPCIIMSRTRPTFYLIPVTTQLSKAVITGQYPAIQTCVLRCATPARRACTGMEDVEYRKLALRFSRNLRKPIGYISWRGFRIVIYNHRPLSFLSLLPLYTRQSMTRQKCGRRLL
jgi:hypothetical protein